MLFSLVGSTVVDSCKTNISKMLSYVLISYLFFN